MLGETKVRPGVYVRITNVGAPAQGNVPQGTVAALFQATWGPLGKTILESADAVTDTYGSGGNTVVPTEAFNGGCRKVVGYRLGTGGTKGALTLQDTTAVTPVNVVRLDALYVGTRGNSLKATVRDSLTDGTKRELLIYEGTTLRQTFTFAKGGGGEVDALVAAVAAGSSWITATKLAPGNQTMAAITQSAFTTGADPAVDGSSYSTALTAIEAEDWNVLCVDTDTTSIHATVQSYIDRVRSEGKRVRAVLGEPTSVAFATRKANASAFNDPAIAYVANGFQKSDGTNLEGFKAAARVAGMQAASPYNQSLTHAIVTTATDLVGGLTNAEIEQAINAGCLVFTKNAAGQVQIEYDINTFVTTTADLDAGWKKNRRVKTRDYLIATISATWDPLVGKVDNNPDGRATLIAAAQGVINAMIRAGALQDGKVIEDPDLAPAGESAWFKIQNLVDNDSAEKMYLTVGFQFAPAA